MNIKTIKELSSEGTGEELTRILAEEYD